MLHKEFGLISIIMAAYNAEKTIEQAINSVLRQTYTDFELLVVNDCSKDRTVELVKSIAAKDNRVRLISNEKNSGVSYTRKHGLEESNGSWIAILDSDDAWTPDKLEKQIELQKRTNADLLFTGSAFMDSDGQPIDWYLHAPAEVTYRQLLKQNVLSNSSALVRKELYAKHYAIGDGMHEDFAIWLSILKEGKKAYGEISQFHQGAGEDSILDTFKLLQDIPNQSLLVIDEVENSLHPQAQRRFVKYLLKLSRVKKLQIILSTHSPFVLEELPPIARIMLMQLSDRKEIVYEVSTNFALASMDDGEHPDLYAFLEDDEAVSLFWEILKQDAEHYEEYSKKISARSVGSCTVVKTLNEMSKSGKLPYPSLCIVDGDKAEEIPDCLALPGTQAPERQIILDLKEKDWNNLDERFGIGAGLLFKYLDDAILLPDHHCWTEYIGNRVKKSKDAVWSIMIEEWCKQCAESENISHFLEKVRLRLRSAENIH